jgi:CheY-like chemotaxis protein
VNLAAVIQDTVEMCRPLLQQHEHDFRIHIPSPDVIYVDADPARLGQVFGNLLNNACRYTEPRGRIRMALEHNQGQAVVTVDDSGIGIPADQYSRIFEMFSQVDRPLNSPRGGLGIGLHLVKRLVEMHGGTIDVQSGGAGHGSRFTVRLPATIESATVAAPAAADTPHAAAPARRILVVDDNADNAELLATLLQIEGHDVHTAHDGLDAINTAERLRPDVVLLDIGLPVIDGFDACRRIREQPWGRQMLLIAITGWGQDSDRRKSHEAGFDHHLVKPVDARIITSLMANAGSSLAR